MTFPIALSGLNAAAKQLDVTAHNIANVGTAGFKQSRVEFSDVFATAANDISTKKSGSGVQVASINQLFSQGNIDFTNNNLDMAISGEGFFVVAGNNGEPRYTRNGSFSVDNEGFIVNSNLERLQAYPALAGSTVEVPNLDSKLADLKLDQSNQPGVPTSGLSLVANLPASTLPPTNLVAAYATASGANPTLQTDIDTAQTTYDTALADQQTAQDALDVALQGTDATAIQTARDDLSAAKDVTKQALADLYTARNALGSAAAAISFNANDADTYSFSTSSVVYDSQGTPVNMRSFFVKQPDDNSWRMFNTFNGNSTAFPADGIPLNFDSTGKLTDQNTAVNGTQFSFQVPGISTGVSAVDPLNIKFELGSVTQFGGKFEVNNVTQNGSAPGSVVGIELNKEGVLSARYTNGTLKPLGSLAIATFANVAGLAQQGNTSWVATSRSGDPQIGTAGTATRGLIQGGALENSNVDLTAQLVQMITAQRNFQANAQMISTSSQLTQTVLNLRN